MKANFRAYVDHQLPIRGWTMPRREFSSCEGTGFTVWNHPTIQEWPSRDVYQKNQSVPSCLRTAIMRTPQNNCPWIAIAIAVLISKVAIAAFLRESVVQDHL